MFLNMLTERQQQSFLALATKVVMADGDVMPEENVTLDIRRAEMGGKVVAPAEEIFGEPNTDVFDTRRAQTIVVLELLVLAMSDDEYHEHERPIIEQLAHHFGFSDEEIGRMEEWAQRQAPLSVQGWNFVGGDIL